MEEDIKKDESQNLYKVTSHVTERLKAAIDVATEKQKYIAAHDIEMKRALEVVQGFIKKKKRVCYGGTAMNMILPEKKRFYNSEYDLPDYDFFTPSMDKDIEQLLDELKGAGFEDVIDRVGIHEGTKKIMVNYNPIADISEISENVYNIFHKRAIVKDGMYYTDPDILRMMMYLELSRPLGQIARWEKVYERLQILNEVFHPKREFILKNQTRKHTSKQKEGSIPDEVRDYILSFCIENRKILISGNMSDFYGSILHSKKKLTYNTKKHTGVVSFFTSDIKADSKLIREHLGGPKVCSYVIHEKRGDILPEYSEILYNHQCVAILFNEQACYSYYNFTTSDGNIMMIASLDTLITMYYSIHFFSNRARSLMNDIDMQIPRLIELVEKNRRIGKSPIPPFSLICKGHQKAFSSLLREKAMRILVEKKKKRNAERKRKTEKKHRE
jgi:hypothetical protein